MNTSDILLKALRLEPISKEEGIYLFTHASTSQLAFVANEIRKKFHDDNKVTWIIDRNVNITNVCIAGCSFCNFHRKPTQSDTYITSIDEYRQKIEELFLYGGDQLLLQGGLHPKLGLAFYVDLFSKLKQEYPALKLHALGPPEIAHIARIEKTTYRDVLLHLMAAGLDSLPGAGAEILSDRVRKQLSPGKCSSQAWLDVMREAHKLNLPTSATMMFGHIETLDERIEHLLLLRNVQADKPDYSEGFIAFIPWPFQDENTQLRATGTRNSVQGDEYVRFIALSRIMLTNIKNIQASWLTVGQNVGSLCLHAGANDFGSIMIEENVVSIAGASHKMDALKIQSVIECEGFQAQRRNQKYEYL